MSLDPVTVVVNSVHRHDQSIDLEIHDSDTALQETPIYGIVIILMEMSKAPTNIDFPQMCGVLSLVTN